MRLPVLVALVSLLAIGLPAVAVASTSHDGAVRVASVPGSAPTLEQTTYSLVKDSTGPPLQSGANITLGFEPAGVAYLYAFEVTSSGISTLSYHGSWSYRVAQLSLHFSAADFNFTKTFALSLPSPTVTMPFQVLTSQAGTSTWQREDLPIDEAVSYVFDSSLADSSLGLSADAAVRVAGAYATSWTGHPSNMAGSSSTRLQPGLSGADTSCLANLVTSVYVGLDSITINPSCSAPLEMILQPDPFAAKGPPLETGQLASDPRVYLNPLSSDGGASDPPNKYAVIIAPFATGTTVDNPTNVALDAKALNSNRGSLSTLVVGGTSLARWATDLTRDGYQVKLLQNNVTIPKLVAAFEHHPGVVIWVGHGNALGALGLDQDQGCMQDPDYHQPAVTIGGTTYPPSANLVHCLNLSSSTDPQDQFSQLAVFPAFWKVLETSLGVSFSKGLVVIDACDTDASAVASTPRVDQKTPVPQSPGALAQAFAAGAYFAWSTEVSAQTSTAVDQYLVDSLVRKTHTAEESFYNMLRVAKTGQMIYKEDADLNGVVTSPPNPANPATDLYDYLDAYGWNGHSLVSYWGNGLDGPETKSFNSGQVWWLMFAARWSHSISIGVDNLKSCEQYWDAGQLGGLKDIFCQNANTGTPPTLQEVNYATYLLVDQPASPAPDAVPRWTLNDAVNVE
jgi:hypothetical protein